MMIATKEKLKGLTNFITPKPDPHSTVRINKNGYRYMMNRLDEEFWRLGMVERDRLGATSGPYATVTSMANSKRNRYNNVSPYDHNRVKLPSATNDYINASYVDFASHTSYIACQGPTPQTVAHFWAMCFNEAQKVGNDVIAVVMVTPLVEMDMVKCHQYWPDDGTIELPCGDLDFHTLSLRHVDSVANEMGRYCVNTFDLEADGVHKQVKHFFYNRWSDAKVPPSANELYVLADDIHTLRQSTPSKQLVPIVHCSAGVGRTGTFIALDQLKYGDHLDTSSSDDLMLDLVSHMRNQRMLMVQTVYQYRWLDNVRKSLIKSRLE